MGKVNQSGFTVIEVILFLAITGVLFAVLMIGVGTGINQQRYLDSARSYKALIQDQYAAALNTENSITQVGECTVDATSNRGAINQDANRNTDRGTSKCVVMGRAIRILPENGGVVGIQTSSVTGYNADNADVQDLSDIDAIVKFNPQIAKFDQSVTDLDWGSYLTTTDNPRRPSEAIIVILRSPSTGNIRVFTSQSSHQSDDLSDIITASNATEILSNCIENGTSTLTPRILVSVDPRISNADGVRLDGGNNEVCQ